MNVTRLDNDALRFECKIRKLPYKDDDQQHNAKQLRFALRHELRDKKVIVPHPPLDPTNEVLEITVYLSGLLEKCTLSTFKKGDKDAEDVYSQLCHAEGRIAYVNWDAGGEEMKKHQADLLKRAEDIRTKYFPHKTLYINYAKEAVDEQGNPLQFTDEQEKELQEVQEKLERLMKLKRDATPGEVTRNNVFDETQSDDEFEEQLERERQTNEMRQGAEWLRIQQERADQQRRSYEAGVKRNTQSFPRNSNPPKTQDIPEQPQFQKTTSGTKQNHPFNESFASDRFNSTRSHERHSNSLPMHKWQMKFSGNADGEVVIFLKDVENMAIAQNTSMDELRKSIGLLLKGRAHDWYRVYGYVAGTWSDFVQRIKEEYLPADFDHRVAEEIRLTKQMPSETFQEFCVRMEMIFMKKTRLLTESEKVEHIKHNMLQLYKTPEIAKLTTVQEMRDNCRYVDSINGRIGTAKPITEKPAVPVKTSKIYEVEESSEIVPYEENAYEQTNVEEPVTNEGDFTGQIYEVKTNQQGWRQQQYQPRFSYPQNHPHSMVRQNRPGFYQNQQGVPQNQPQYRPQFRPQWNRQNNPAVYQNLQSVICHNCKLPGHFASMCTAPKRKRCTGCTAWGVSIDECVYCNRNPQEPRNPSAPPAENSNLPQ